MTNSERRISRVRAAVPPPGEARPDWRIAVDFARKFSADGARLFPYEDPECIFNEHRETTCGRDLDITGVSYALLDAEGPQQWPFPEGASEGKRRLYENGKFPTPTGRARFIPTPYRAVSEDVDEQYPLRLTTARLRDQWHAMSRTGTVASLFSHEPEPRISVHPDDLARLGCDDQGIVRVTSRRGQLYVPAAADARVRPGVVSLTMHWGARFLGGRARHGINELTIGALDPSSHQPELKHCAVRIDPAKLPWRLVAFGSPSEVSALFEALGPMMDAFPYASRTLIGSDRAGVRLVLASDVAPPRGVLDQIDAAFGLHARDVATEEGAGVTRRVVLEEERVVAVRISGDPESESWRSALSALSRGRIVCNCFDVGESEIDAFLATRRSLEELQHHFRCGTNCGSCLPELRKKAAACATLLSLSRESSVPA
jgi:assimilatory nitrate reductase catalytic subunit